ncbi:MAG: TatD family hydrolase [Armatimonadota bacterium]
MLIDTHCHLNSPEFAGRVPEVLGRASGAGVTEIVVPGWDGDSSRRALSMAGAYPMLHPAIGLHPWFADTVTDLTWLTDLLDDPRLVAIGEIGLDWLAEVDHHRQEAVFRAQLAIASTHGLPVLIHCRRGWDRMLACLRDFPTVRGVLHAFSGSREVLHECLALGHYVSFAAMVTRRNSRRAQDAAREVPADRLLLETDAPYMALEGVPASEVEPAHLSRILAFLAELRGENPAALAAQTTANARELFRM